MSDATALSPDQRWRFADGKLRSRGTVYEPYRPWNFGRWTYACFSGDDALILAFETDYEWDDFYNATTGDELGGLLVLVLQSESTWRLVELDYDVRLGDPFAPTAVVWHPRGVLAWIDQGRLFGRVLHRPRTFDGAEPEGLLYSDDYILVRAELESHGPWDTLYLSEDGVVLTVAGPAGFAQLNMDDYRISRDGRPWQDQPETVGSGIWWRVESRGDQPTSSPE